MKKILITGARGRIGNEVVSQLRNRFDFIEADLPQCDARDLSQLNDLAEGVDCILHLAWDTNIDNYKSDTISLDNTRMFLNVYELAERNNIPRVIMASSVHAGVVSSSETVFNSVRNVTPAQTKYGAHKQMMECLGSHFAARGLEVICFRFGGVCYGDSPDSDPAETHLWLSRTDMVNLVEKAVDKDRLLNKFIIIPAISNNVKQDQEFPENEIGWIPKDNAYNLI